MQHELSIEEFNHFALRTDGIRRGSLMKVLAYLQMENDTAAVKLAASELETGETGGYKNNGKDIYEHVVLNDS